jgi:hypothetical protein
MNEPTQKVARKHIDELFAQRRWCFYIPADSYVEGRGWRVSIVFEDEAGHFPTGNWPYDGSASQKAPWFWGPSYEDAVAMATEQNEKIGVDAMRAAKIVAASMGADKPRRGRRP